mmetsp:Transcript_3723/g.9376  ORF Transcript_3723/g.9376 Transcript_3723/m.9376 type:complete len:278 (+) Transcript_3723:1371-2204(+)
MLAGVLAFSSSSTLAFTTASMLAKPLLRPGGRRSLILARSVIWPASMRSTASASRPSRPSTSSASKPLETLASAEPLTLTVCWPLPGAGSSCTATLTTAMQPGTRLASGASDGGISGPSRAAILSPSCTSRRLASFSSLLSPIQVASSPKRGGSSSPTPLLPLATRPSATLRMGREHPSAGLLRGPQGARHGWNGDGTQGGERNDSEVVAKSSRIKARAPKGVPQVHPILRERKSCGRAPGSRGGQRRLQPPCPAHPDARALELGALAVWPEEPEPP